MRSFWQGLGSSEAHAASSNSRRRHHGVATTRQLAKGAQDGDGAAGRRRRVTEASSAGSVGSSAPSRPAGGQICCGTLVVADPLSRRRGLWHPERRGAAEVFSQPRRLWGSSWLRPNPPSAFARRGFGGCLGPPSCFALPLFGPPGSSAPGQPCNFLPIPGKRVGLGAGRARDASPASGLDKGQPDPKVTCQTRRAARLCHAKEETGPLTELARARKPGGSAGGCEDEYRRGVCFGLLRLPPPSPAGQLPS